MRRSWLMTGLLLLLALTGCGQTRPLTTVNLKMRDYVFDPETFTIPAGQEITITGQNNGAVTHEFVLVKLGTDAGLAFGDEDEENIYWEFEVESGKQVTETFTAPTEPGVYQYVCGIEGHLTAGMKGTLVVVAP